MVDRIWKPIPGYEGSYEVSNDGQVRSLDRIRRSGVPMRGRIRKQATSKGGHKRVHLSLDGNTKYILVHHAVMEAFVGPRPDGLVCCHDNGNPADNRLENLRYDTLSENSMDSVVHGTCFQSSKTHCPAGHRYDRENTRLVKTPAGSMVGRQCRTCDRRRQQEKRAANRDKYNAAARKRRQMKRKAA